MQVLNPNAISLHHLSLYKTPHLKSSSGQNIVRVFSFHLDLSFWFIFWRELSATDQHINQQNMQDRGGEMKHWLALNLTAMHVILPCHYITDVRCVCTVGSQWIQEEWVSDCTAHQQSCKSTVWDQCLQVHCLCERVVYSPLFKKYNVFWFLIPCSPKVGVVFPLLHSHWVEGWTKVVHCYNK